jgi:hypothetical protein
MSRIKLFLAVPMAFAIVLAVLAVGGSRVAAGGETTIIVHHRLCPTDQTIDDIFEDCHDGLVGQSFEFTVESSAGQTTFVTDAATSEGSVTVPAGDVELWGGVPGEFATTFVYCSQDQVALDLADTDFGVSFTAPDGEVVCDWYNTPIDLSGDDDDGAANDDDDTGTVAQLPNTGVGRNSGTPGTALMALLTGVATVGAAGVLTLRRQA